MADFSKWKQDELAVVNLRLDPHNPRMPEATGELSQRELTEELVAYDKVYELAKEIVDKGYYPIERLIVVKENRKNYVVEGNRRLAALQLLISPEGAPEDAVKKFKALSTRINADAIKKVEVSIAPSREAAAPVIMSRHTQSQIESWSRIMQARFYKNLVDSGLSIQDISEQYHIPLSDIKEFLRSNLMYNIACTLDLPKKTTQVLHDQRKFPMTTLERLYGNPEVAQFLGIEFDNKKELVGKVKSEEFKKGYSKMVSDIAAKEIDSRKVNDKDLVKDYLGKFGNKKPNLRKKGTFTAASLLKKVKSKATEEEQHTKAKTRAKPKPVALIPSSIACDVNNQRINDVYTELRTLRVANYPNATGIMLRSLLEMSLGYYLDRTGHLTKLVAAEKKRVEKKGNTLRQDWHPGLMEMLKYVVNKDKNIINNGNVLRVLNKLISERDKLLSVDSLNLFVHNQFIHPDEPTLRRFWSQLEGLFQITLIEPDDNE